MKAVRYSTSSRDHFDVLVIGNAVADVIGLPVDMKKLPRKGGLQLIDSVTLTSGGNVSNVGIDLAKLGLRVGVLTRVGNDSLGRFLTDQYRMHGINTKGVIVDHKRQTSATMVNVGKDGERTFLHTRGCMANFRARDVLTQLSLVKKAALVAVGYLGLLPETEKQFGRLFKSIKRNSSAAILLDTAGVPKTSFRSLKEWLHLVDYFLPSYDEAVYLTALRQSRRMVQYFRRAGAVGVVGIKLGAKGCFISAQGEERFIRTRRMRNVIDATGAGDAFVAGFIAATLRGSDPFEAASIGNAVAANCMTAVGASTAINRLKRYMA